MIINIYTIKGQSVKLATNDSGNHLFIWSDSDANYHQIYAGLVCNNSRLEDKKYVRRAMYALYHRRFAI